LRKCGNLITHHGKYGRIDLINILVTGNKGYIGSVLIPLLLKKGHDVHGLDSNLYENSLFDGKNIARVPTTFKDIREVKKQDVKGYDAVIHLAGLSNDPLGYLNESITMDINYKATIKLAKLSKEARVQRFIFSSTCSNYGASGDQLIDETGPVNPVTPYGRSKVAAEYGLLKLNSKDFCVTLPRSGTAYGFSPMLRFDLVLNNLVAWAFSTGQVHLKSNGSPWRPIVHVEDISRAFISMLNAPMDGINGEIFNIGSTKENYQVRDIANIVKETVEDSQISFADDAGPDVRCYKVNCDKLKNQLGFQTKWTAKKGAEEVYYNIKRIGLTLEEFEGPRYRRVDALKKSISEGILDQEFRRV